MMDSLAQLIKALQHKQISSVELTSYYLERIKKHASINAFITVDEENALVQAKKADRSIKNGTHALLTGIPLAHKDNFCTRRLTTTCGSRMLANFKSPFDATIVQKLEQQGAIMLGKTNMDEFAMGASNESSYFGCVKNPHQVDCVPGGSSGGSAAAVAAGLAAFTTGSDTGGSIRQPASFCGVSGIKPTYGLVSRLGMVAFASSLDQAGPLARSAEDLALILSAMAGFDCKDSTSVQKKIPDYTCALTTPIKNLRIGLPRCFMDHTVDASVRNAITAALQEFTDSGAEIIPLDLNLHSYWVACYYVIACAEASSNLSRYDGLRFGYRDNEARTLKDTIIRSRETGFGAEVKRRILTGTYVLSSGYYDAYYLQALKIRRLISEELQRAFKSVDILLGPTAPTPAFSLNRPLDNASESYLADLFTVGANLAGLPAVSIPAGFKDTRPIGMQLMANHFQESLLLNTAHHFQQRTTWHLTKPTGFSL